MTSKPLTRASVRGWFRPRARNAHKGDFGHVLVVAGSQGMMGAGRLCALGALRGGAGLVTLAVPGDQRLRGPWEVMTLPLPSASGAFALSAAGRIARFVKDRRVTSVALGPGLSRQPGAAALARRLLSILDGPLVADADALNALAAQGLGKNRKAPWIVTPHPGEAARLLKTTARKIVADRAGAADQLAERLGAVVLLKGAGTIVTDGDARFVNGTGHPGMATGGMGDVLTGLIAALIPQVRSSSPREACLRAAAAAAWLHGWAGEQAAREVGPVGLMASDVAARLPAAFKEIS